MSEKERIMKMNSYQKKNAKISILMELINNLEQDYQESLSIEDLDQYDDFYEGKSKTEVFKYIWKYIDQQIMATYKQLWQLEND